MKPWTILLALAFLPGAALRAQDTAAPAASPALPALPGPTSRPWGGVSGDRPGFLPVPTPEEWEQVQAFARENSPRRFKLFESINDESPRKRRWKAGIAWYYKRLQEMKEQDPQMYDMRVKRMRIEDTIFGLAGDLKKSNQPDTDALNAKLKESIGQWVDLGMQERQQRIERLEKALAAEKQKLVDDKSKRDSIVDERLQKVMSSETGEMEPFRGGGPGGPGGPPGMRGRHFHQPPAADTPTPATEHNGNDH